jgi:hypothetical protein
MVPCSSAQVSGPPVDDELDAVLSVQHSSVTGPGQKPGVDM